MKNEKFKKKIKERKKERGRNEGSTSDWNKRQNQVGRASGDEMRESG